MSPRIIFMGTPEFAVEPLRACMDVGEVAMVVTQPDRPKGRGQQLTSSPVKRLALDRGIPIRQPLRVKERDFVDALRVIGPDVCVVAAYGKILPREILDLPLHGCLNVHASLLPRFRGAAPVQWSIAFGDKRTGVCLMKMEEGLDTGPVLACLEVPIRPDETGGTLMQTLAVLGGTLVRDFLPPYLRGALAPKPQPMEGVVLAPMLRKEDARIDFQKPAIELERRIRAFDPWPGAFAMLYSERIKIHRARSAEGSGPPGSVLALGPEGIEVACQSGSLVLVELQPEGKRRMHAAEFLAGHSIAIGSQPFGAPE